MDALLGREDGTGRVRIERITALPEGIDVMRAEAVAEGFDHIETLWRQWHEEDTRFAHFGEMLVAAFVDDELAGIGGVTLDFIDHNFLRMRRFYVRPKFRRLGVARTIAVYLVSRALTLNRPLVLYTDTARGAAFWQSMGFVPVEREKTTHIFPSPDDDFNFASLQRRERVAGALSYWLLDDASYQQHHTRVSGERAIEVFAESVGLEPDGVRSTVSWPDSFEMRLLSALIPLVEADCRQNEPGLLYDTPMFPSKQDRLDHGYMSHWEKAFDALQDCELIDRDGHRSEFAEWNANGKRFIEGILRYGPTVEILRRGGRVET